MFSGDTMIIDYKCWFENILSMLTMYWSNAIFAINVESSFIQRWPSFRIKNTPITAAINIYPLIQFNESRRVTHVDAPGDVQSFANLPISLSTFYERPSS